MTFNTINMGKLFYGVALSTMADREKQFSAKEQILEALAKRVAEVQSKSVKKKGQAKENDFPELREFISAIDEMEQYSRDSRTNCVMLGIFFNLSDPKSRGEIGDSIANTIGILEASANRIDQMIHRIKISIELCFALASEASCKNSKTKPMQLMNLLPSFASRPIVISSTSYPMVGEGVPVDTISVMSPTAFRDWSMSSSSSSSTSSSFSSFEIESQKKEHKSRKKQLSLKGRVSEDTLEPGRLDPGFDHKERRQAALRPVRVPALVPRAAPSGSMCGGRFKHLTYPCTHRQR